MNLFRINWVHLHSDLLKTKIFAQPSKSNSWSDSTEFYIKDVKTLKAMLSLFVENPNAEFWCEAVVENAKPVITEIDLASNIKITENIITRLFKS